jgi:hypothetical protein
MKRAKNVVGKCIICGKFTEDAETYSDDDPTGVERVCVCATCCADAALGRAVRRMPAWSFLYQNSVGWFCGTEMSQGTRTYGPKGDTPEAALKAAGLMEVKE